MLIAKIENQQVVDVADYTAMFPDTSFPPSGPSDEFLAENNCAKINLWLEHTDQQKLVSVEPYLLDGWVYTVKVEDKTAEELQADIDSQAAKIRSERNQRLADTDWTQLADAPVDSKLWSEYRQQLRDVTKQPNFPSVIIWPTQPDAVSQIKL